MNEHRALSKAQQALVDIWEEHCRYEFETRDTEAARETMVEDAYVNHVPTLTGGVGKPAQRRFYGERFIPQTPPDTELIPIHAPSVSISSSTRFTLHSRIRSR